MPVIRSPIGRSTVVVTTRVPLRRTLSYSSETIATLSPPADSTRSFTGVARPVKLSVQLVESPLASSTYVVGVVSPCSGTDRMFHLPCIAATGEVAGIAAVAVPAGATTAAVSETLSSLPAQAATRRRAPQRAARGAGGRIGSSRV